MGNRNDDLRAFEGILWGVVAGAISWYFIIKLIQLYLS